MSEPLKIVIPMAGWGTRMRPHTWSKPKPLVAVAGRTALEYLVEMFASVPASLHPEFVFILGPYLGEEQIPPFISEHYPKIKAHYVVQAEMKGQSHAIYLARSYLAGPMIMCFSDTFIETDFSFLDREKSDGVAWVKPISDPRRFGVAELNSDGWVTRLIEKPQSLDNNLALVGCYYFKNSEDLLSAIEQQMLEDIRLKDEFFLVDAINIMLKRRALMRVEKISTWLDTGTIAATLETNHYLLERFNALPSADRHQGGTRAGVTINPPVFIHESARIEDSTIGPYASIGSNCRITGSQIEESIIDSESQVTNAALNGCVVGRRVHVRGNGGKEVFTLNLGDDSSVTVGW